MKTRCSGGIGSLVELLQGKLSSGVMQVVTSSEAGLFPKPKEINLSCSCPDSAYMCKHVAAVLYGVGTRLDEQPDLLFKLRQVDHLELIAEAGINLGAADSGETTIAAGDLADVFGIEIDTPEPQIQTNAAEPAKRTPARKSRATAAVKPNKPGRPAVRTAEKTKPEAPAKPGRPITKNHRTRSQASDREEEPPSKPRKNLTTDYTDDTDREESDELALSVEKNLTTDRGESDQLALSVGKNSTTDFTDDTDKNQQRLSVGS